MAAALAPSTRGEASRERADDELLAIFRRLRPDRLDDLDRVWSLCADELYGLALWRTGSEADAEDVVQEVFATLGVRAGRLQRIRRPRAYLLAMAHNAARRLLRRRRRHAELGEVAAEAFFETDLERRTDGRRLAAGLGTLSPVQREVMYLRYFVGLSFREIGQVTGVPTFTAASRLRLGVERLRRTMGVEP